MKWSEKTKADKIITVLMIVFAVGYFSLGILTLWDAFEKWNALEMLMCCLFWLNMGLLCRKQNPKQAIFWFVASGTFGVFSIIECILLLL